MSGHWIRILAIAGCGLFWAGIVAIVAMEMMR